MENGLTINVDELRTMLEDKEHVVVLDVRPKDQREEWQIPGSMYVDAYQRLNANDPTVLDEITIPENSKVVTVCAAGRTSQIAANELRKKGIEAYSLEGGMKAWSLAWNKAVISFSDYKIIQLRRTGKGCLSYILVSNNKALVIDASVSPEVYENIIKENNWQLKAVMETHIHADHLSRSKLLAENNKVDLYLPVPNKVSFDYKTLKANQTLVLGNIEIKVIATPGHTIESVSFLINNEVLFTGDTLFTNAVGRPDLKASDEEVKQRAELLYESLQLLMKLNDEVIVLPAHTNTPVDFDNTAIQATIGEIRNKVLLLKLVKADFIKTILNKLPLTPPNFLDIVERNLSGNITGINPVDLEAGANRCAIS
jgi:glyoxylase-like metal-dependent hydrolase (beta-lactamase superfamily II)/rhodanese-related sulfurtransferase